MKNLFADMRPADSHLKRHITQIQTISRMASSPSEFPHKHGHLNASLKYLFWLPVKYRIK